MDDELIVVLADRTRVVFSGDVDAQSDGDGDLLVYAPNWKGKGARLAGFYRDEWKFWYLAGHAEVYRPDEPEDVVHDPKGLLTAEDGE